MKKGPNCGRGKAGTCGLSFRIDFKDIAGHVLIKRAFEVAAAGDHSVLLVGPRGVGKDTLLAAFNALGFSIPARAVLSCWCGVESCHCSGKAQERYVRRLRVLASQFDLLLEVCGVPVKEYGHDSGRGSSAEALARILPVRALQRGKQPLEVLLKQLDDAGRRMFEMAVRRLTLGCGDTQIVLQIARTIADLAREESITARAVAEAVQYRAPWFMRP